MDTSLGKNAALNNLEPAVTTIAISARQTTSPARCYFTISRTVVECCVEAEAPVIVIV